MNKVISEINDLKASLIKLKEQDRRQQARAELQLNLNRINNIEKLVLELINYIKKLEDAEPKLQTNND
jgi:hypothetical protein